MDSWFHVTWPHHDFTKYYFIPYIGYPDLEGMRVGQMSTIVNARRGAELKSPRLANYNIFEAFIGLWRSDEKKVALCAQRERLFTALWHYWVFRSPNMKSMTWHCGHTAQKDCLQSIPMSIQSRIQSLQSLSPATQVIIHPVTPVSIQ